MIVPISSPWPILANTESSSGERMRGTPLRTTMIASILLFNNPISMSHVISPRGCAVLFLAGSEPRGVHFFLSRVKYGESRGFLG